MVNQEACCDGSDETEARESLYKGHSFRFLRKLYFCQSKKISRWHHVPEGEQPLRTIVAVFGNTCLIEYSLFLWKQQRVKLKEIEKSISEAYARENLRERVAFRLPFSHKVRGPHIIWENKAYERHPEKYVWAHINSFCADSKMGPGQWPAYSAAKMYDMALNSLVDIINKECVDSII